MLAYVRLGDRSSLKYRTTDNTNFCNLVLNCADRFFTSVLLPFKCMVISGYNWLTIRIYISLRVYFRLTLVQVGGGMSAYQECIILVMWLNTLAFVAYLAMRQAVFLADFSRQLEELSSIFFTEVVTHVSVYFHLDPEACY